mgnify:CR=1 FL=1
MKSQVLKRIKSFVCIKEVVDNYIKYYNNEQYQYELAKTSSNKYIKYYRTGIYLLKNAIEEPVNHIEKIEKIKAQLSFMVEEKSSNISFN